MGQQIPTTHSFNLPDGQTVTIETGKLAMQAHGSVVVRVGDMMIFAAVVSNTEMKADAGFFPLSVDYQEKFASAGRIPGNFFRRETRLSEYEILISRLVDRAIRPLFPDEYKNETQVTINLISADKEILPDAYVALATSAALTLSDIPFAGPISEVRVARIDGQFHINPTRSNLEKADINIIVAATKDNVVMVEGEANECQESEMVDAIRVGHEAIKTQIDAQLELAKKFGSLDKPKRTVEPAPENEEIKNKVYELAHDKLNQIAHSFLEKQVRKSQFEEVKAAVTETLLAEKGEEYMAENGKFVSVYFDKLKKDVVREMVMAEKVRLDGRKPNEIRPIWCEVDYLPSPHGSSIFTRGETQALATVTLGSKLDEMMMDSAFELYFEKFILHYNFPAFSVGEVRPARGPGRREVGHANLAARSLRKVLPPELPYTVRIVSDVLESNGSSSMATVCSGSMALMDSGIQIAAPVSGIAMGLISDGKRNAILSDILGDEDALGDMDFKVTGTAKGICGCQMDIKIEGLSFELLTEALNQAKEGRLHILGKMSEAIEHSREDYKPHAPRIEEIIIDKSFIGAVIGPGGKIIQEMQKLTGTIITIEEKNEKGYIQIVSSNKDGVELAKEKIANIVFVPEVGQEYDAVVESLMPFGAFAKFRNASGLVHISEISHARVENVADVLKVGQSIRVKLIEIDQKTGKYRLSMKALQPRPEKPANKH